MSRSNAFRTLQRWLALANAPREDLQATLNPADRSPRSSARRRLIGTAGAAAVAGPSSWLAVHAAPATQGGVGIVGAGLAGLQCADWLASKGVRATVFEAQSRTGGRCWSLRGLFPGQVAERGGEYIDTGHVTMRGLANRFGLTLENVEKLPGEDVYFFGGVRYTEAQVVAEFRAFVPRMRDDLRRLSNGPTALRNNAYDRELDHLSLREYLDSRGAGPLIRHVLDVAYTIEYGRESDRQSCLAFLFFAHAYRRAKFTPFGVFSDERFHVVEGNDAITTGLANTLPGQIELGHRLVRIGRTAGGRIRLTFATAGPSVETEHDVVVLTLPFTALRDVEFTPNLELPPWKRQVIDQFDYGTNSKLMVGFEGRPWLTQFGSTGISYSDLPNHQTTWETNPVGADGQRGILTDYSGGERGARLDPAATAAEANAFLADLDRVYPGIAARARRSPNGSPLAFLENWSRLPLFRGSYTSNAPGYFTTLEGLAGLPAGNLLFAGEHTDSFYDWQGFMEGACLTGIRAGQEAFARLRGKA